MEVDCKGRVWGSGMKTAWWLSTNRMTVGVTTNSEDIIVETAPIVYKFKGQPLTSLLRWLSKQGEVKLRVMVNAPRK